MLRFLIAVLFFVARVHSDCYTLNRDSAKNTTYYTGNELVSCGRGTNNCCLANEECSSNLLCRSRSGYGRQYCADSSWVGCSSSCPGGRDAGVSMKECPQQGPNMFCCGNCNCTTDSFFVDPSTGELRSASNFVSAQPTFWTIDSSAILASASASRASVSARSLSITPSALPTALSSSVTAPATSTAQMPASPSGLSPGAAAGIGVGATVAVIGIGLLASLLLRERKKRKALQEQSARDQAPQGPIYERHGLTDTNKDVNANISVQSPQQHVYRTHEADGAPRHELH